MTLAFLAVPCSAAPSPRQLRAGSRAGCFALQIPLSCLWLWLPTRDGLNNTYCSAWFPMQMFLARLLFLNNLQCLLSGQKKQLTLPAQGSHLLEAGAR